MLMESEVALRCQEVVKCDLCKEPVSFYCRRCVVNLCDTCVPTHLRVKSEFGHDILDIGCKDEKDSCFCDAHPQYDCSVYCKTCDATICILCVSLKHKSHEITELFGNIELFKSFLREKNRLQLIKHKLKPILNNVTKLLSSLSSIYQKKKDEVTHRGEEWHKVIEKTVKTLHNELDDLKKEHKAALYEQKRDIEEIIERINKVTRKATKLQKLNDIEEMKSVRPDLEGEGTIKDITQYTFPVFCSSKIDEDYLLTYFGYIEKIQQKKVLLPHLEIQSDCIANKKLVEVPVVTCIADSGFPIDEKHKGRLYDLAVTGDEIWMGGYSNELKLFNLHGNFLRTVKIACHGLYIGIYNKRVVFSDVLGKTIKKVDDDDSIMTLLTTEEWLPYGVTGTASGNLLVCLLKGDQSKVVRFSSTCSVLQEIQYDSQCQPLYNLAWYIAESVNGDVIVSDFRKKMIIAVDSLGIYRYSYSGKKGTSDLTSLATNSVGHVLVTDFQGNMIHMLDRDGKFLKYIIPSGAELENPRAVCIINDNEIIVGECLTGLAKTIKIIEEKC